jgi:hypothetical protein
MKSIRLNWNNLRYLCEQQEIFLNMLTNDAIKIVPLIRAVFMSDVSQMFTDFISLYKIA